MQKAFQLFQNIKFEDNHPISNGDIELKSFDPHEALNVELPMQLANNSEVVLHASSVIIQNSIFAFAGISGTGKSTIAHELVKAGHKLFSDEALILRESGDTVLCYTFPQQIRLWKGSEKESLELSNDFGPYQLKQLYLLHNDQEQSITPLSQLLQSTYRPDTRNNQLDLRLLNLVCNMTHSNLVSLKKYSPDPDSFQSLQNSINSLL